MIHQHVGQLINQAKGMRGALWSVEELMDESGGAAVNVNAHELWLKVKQSHRAMRHSLQLLADELPDEDLSLPF